MESPFCRAGTRLIETFGWDGTAIPDDLPAQWDEAEILTNQATEHDYAVLAADEAEEFAALCEAAVAAVH